jgi:5-formyltetrahydrofolate cyclo-ligase
MPKIKLRRIMLEKRKKLSSEERRNASFHIQQSLLESEVYVKAKHLVLYSSIHNEVDSSLVMNDALTSGRKVFLPVVADMGLIFREVKETTALQKGAFGIMEPPASNSVISPEKVDLIVVPGIAFDLQGHRVGYGKGYYDKALHSLEKQGKLIAVCYDFQLVDEIAGEPHDVMVDMMITEKRIVRPLRKDQQIAPN